MKRAKLRATRVHLFCPHCSLPRRESGGGTLLTYTRGEVLDLLNGEESVAIECQYCGKQHALHAGTVNWVWPL